MFWLQESMKFVFVVATANDVSKLPPELLRKGRFDELFFVDLPQESERKEIINIYTKQFLNQTLDENMLNKLAELSDGFSGADIESTIKEIAYKTIVSGDESITEHILVANFENVVPLSKTNPEKIEMIRTWGKDRAIPASGLQIESSSEENKRKVLI